MRHELKQRDGLRFRCRATVQRFGSKTGYRGSKSMTILLSNVIDVSSGKLMTDHLWFTVGKWSERLVIGSVFEFDARATDYIKGYQGRRAVSSEIKQDWKLARPTKIEIIF